jgi:tRNA(Ile)-lysidine synthase
MIIKYSDSHGVKYHPNSLYAIIYFTMLDKIAKILQQECKLNLTNPLLVGVSGGPDSLCLLHVLHIFGYTLIAAHVNHKLRPEADGEAEVVRQFTRLSGIEFISTEVDVRSYASEHSLSIEETARTLRYRYLFKQAEHRGAVAVLVAHTADDQVETILMHLLRGSGLTGLLGMEYRTLPNPWSDRIALVRPLLSTWREEILEYLAENEIMPVTDSSNRDTTFFRNRLRLELLPTLERYNPRVRHNLLRASRIMRDDYSVLQHLVNEAWEINLAYLGPGYLAFRRPGILELPPSIQRYLLRNAIASFLPGLHDVDFDCIERGLKFLAEGRSDSQADLMAGICIFREENLIWLASSWGDLPLTRYPAIAPGGEFILTIPSTVSLNDGWQLQARVAPDLMSAIQDSQENQDPYQAWMDSGKIASPLRVCCRAAGDRIQPIGMDGHSIKISDLMINLKLPKRVRKTWPLVSSGEHILWVPGCRLSQVAQVSTKSRSVVHLTLSRNLST